MQKFGLALGGGGFKGLAHIGVLQVLKDYNLRPSYISGTSAGSIIAALFACQVDPYDMEKIVCQINIHDYLDYDLGGMFKYFLSCLVPFEMGKVDGFLKGVEFEKLIYKLTRGKSFQDITTPLSVITCDINSGKTVIFTNQNFQSVADDLIIIRQALVSKAVRASIAVPVIFAPEYYDEMKLLDGGLKDYVPAMVQKMMGAPYVLAVNLGKKAYKCPVKGMLPIVARSVEILTFETSRLKEELFVNKVIYPIVKSEDWDNKEQACYIIRAGRRAMEDNIAPLLKDLRRYTSNRKEPPNIY